MPPWLPACTGWSHLFSVFLIEGDAYEKNRTKDIGVSVEEGIYTEEGNPFVPVWNHEICLSPMTEDACEYIDCVEIQAGWKTGFVTLWAQYFYRHRQKSGSHC